RLPPNPSLDAGVPLVAEIFPEAATPAADAGDVVSRSPRRDNRQGGDERERADLRWPSGKPAGRRHTWLPRAAAQTSPAPAASSATEPFGSRYRNRTRCREETSHVPQYIDLANPQSSRRLRSK